MRSWTALELCSAIFHTQLTNSFDEVVEKRGVGRDALLVVNGTGIVQKQNTRLKHDTQNANYFCIGSIAKKKHKSV